MRDEALLLKKHSLHDSLLLRRYDYFLRFLLKGALAGTSAGVVGVAFRLVLTEGDLWRSELLKWAHTLPGWGWLVLPCLGAWPVPWPAG